MVYKISRKFEMSCSHRLFDKNLSEIANRIIFGKCSNEPSHGHNYIVELILEGISLDNGMLKNFSEVKNIFNSLIHDKYDHQFLNNVMQDIPTAENMCREIFNILHEQLPGLEIVRIWETADCYAEYAQTLMIDGRQIVSCKVAEPKTVNVSDLMLINEPRGRRR